MQLIENAVFEAAGPDIVHEVVDGEAIVISLDSGCYFNLSETGAFIWTRMTEGATLRVVADELCSHYPGAAPAIEQDLVEFIAGLQAEGLIRVANLASAPRLAPTALELNGVYTAPTMRKHTDLVDSLQVEPIQEAELSGHTSPHASKPAPGAHPPEKAEPQHG